MARRWIRTERAIAVLGAAVLALGALIAWRVWEAQTFSPESADERVRDQLLGYDPALRPFDLSAARTPGVLCGYAGSPGGEVVRFVSRPNRLLTSRDPLSGEFREQVRRECPAYFASQPTPR